MRAAGLDINGDWRFGRGLASYIGNSAAIAQNVATRLKSFKRDWFMDAGAGIDWIDLLGRKNAQDRILREVERVAAATDGVMRIVELSIDANRGSRSATISLRYRDIFNAENSLSEQVEL